MNTYSVVHRGSFDSVNGIVTRRLATEGRVIAWTDGACEPNPGWGGWGIRLEGEGFVTEARGGACDTTNNRMELLAIVEAVQREKTGKPMIVRTDSQLCVICAVGLWKRRTNHDLWDALGKAVMRRIERDSKSLVMFEWWRGHVGTAGNERADELAQIGRLEAMDEAGA